MKRLLPLLVAVMISSIFWGNSILNVMAEEPETAKIFRYYKSVEIQQGESLWSIASSYNTHSQMSTNSYIKELRNMNGLNGDTIHAGQHLTILYFSEDHK